MSRRTRDILDAFASEGLISEGLVGPGAGMTIKEMVSKNAEVTISAETIESLIAATKATGNTSLSLEEIVSATKADDAVGLLVHPKTVRAAARAGLSFYLGADGRVHWTKVEGGGSAPAEPVPTVDLSKIDKDFYLEPKWAKDLARFLDRDMSVLLIGPAGCGKSEGAERAFAHRKQKSLVVSCSPSMDADDMEGKVDLVDGDTVFTPAAPVIASQEGHGLILDEVDAAPAEACYSLYRLLDHRKMAVVRKGHESEIERHADLRIVGTQNTEGRGDSAGLFHGRAYQDEAFLDRWDNVIRVGYPCEADEITILRKRTGVSQKDAQNVVRAANLIRRASEEGHVLFTMSLRRTQAVCGNIVHGSEVSESWAWGVLNRCTREDREKIVELLKRVYGSTVSLNKLKKH